MIILTLGYSVTQHHLLCDADHGVVRPSVCTHRTPLSHIVVDSCSHVSRSRDAIRLELFSFLTTSIALALLGLEGPDARNQVDQTGTEVIPQPFHPFWGCHQATLC